MDQIHSSVSLPCTHIRDQLTHYEYCRFENKGSMMGCSNPHPHGQAWSLSYVPSIPERMIQSQRQFAKEHEPVKGVPTLYVLPLYPIRKTKQN